MYRYAEDSCAVFAYRQCDKRLCPPTLQILPAETTVPVFLKSIIVSRCIRCWVSVFRFISLLRCAWQALFTYFFTCTSDPYTVQRFLNMQPPANRAKSETHGVTHQMFLFNFSRFLSTPWGLQRETAAFLRWRETSLSKSYTDWEGWQSKNETERMNATILYRVTERHSEEIK